MIFFRFIAIFFFSIIEIKVKAIQQDPKNCLNNSSYKSDCAIIADSNSDIKTSTIDLSLREGSIFYRNSKGLWNFVIGTVRISSKKNIKITTKVGLLQLSKGQYWLNFSKDKLWIVTINGMAKVLLNSSPLTYNFVSEGFMNWYGLIDFKSQNSQGVARMIDPLFLNEFIPNFSQNDYKMKTQTQKRSLAQSSQFYKDVVQAGIDIERNQFEQLQSRKRNRLLMQSRAREMFRSKHLRPLDLSHQSRESE